MNTQLQNIRGYGISLGLGRGSIMGSRDVDAESAPVFQLTRGYKWQSTINNPVMHMRFRCYITCNKSSDVMPLLLLR